MDEREFFDQLSSSWDDNEVLSTPDKIMEILGYVEIKPGEEILDLGTGTGVLLPYIAGKTGTEGRITAVDFSTGMLEKAKSKFINLVPSPKFINLDFENEAIKGKFDHIFLYSVYPHLKQPITTLKRLIAENLKENGSIYIAFPCGPDFINKMHEERKAESDLLPSASELALFLKQSGILAKAILDSEDAYLIKIKRTL